MERAIAAIGVCALFAATAGTAAPTASAQSLRGSRASMDRQFNVAVQHDYSFLDNTKDVSRFVSLGLLVAVRPGRHFELAQVSYPYARPGVRTFIDRLASQYFAACGERLVVTSLTRPTGKQPRNASDQSVHPAGMAVDLRISRIAKCRTWLERTLLALEKNGVLDATRERRPAHYHIAVFPQQYLTYVARQDGRGATLLAADVQSAAETRVAAAVPPPGVDAVAAADSQSAAATARVTEPPVVPPPANTAASTAVATVSPETADAGAEESAPATVDYRVHRGDTLWSIARRHGTSVQELKALNNMNGSRIAAGQVIVVPAPGQQQ
jgi:LysM repeat protein